MSHQQTIDFIGIGAGRSGSTWLTKCLYQHPDIMFAEAGETAVGSRHLNDEIIKEIDFFTSPRTHRTYDSSSIYKYDRGLDWYFSLFPPAQPGKIRGEFSPAYLHDPMSPELIHDVLPNVKLMATLRNPVDLVYSYYLLRNNSVEFGGKYTFEEVVDRGYLLNRGMHYENLSRFLQVFPREQFHIVQFEQVKNNPAELIRGVYEFLGVRSDFVPEALNKKVNATAVTKNEAVKGAAATVMSIMNKLGLTKIRERLVRSSKLYRIYRNFNVAEISYKPMNPEIRQRLVEHYRADIEGLEQLLGWDLSEWKG